MPTPHRLRKHADYQHAYAASRKRSSRQITYFFALRPADRRSETAGPRVGLTVPKALGKAHDRNRIKRRMRAAVRTHIALLPPAVDVILHPRRSVLTAEYAKLEREVADVFRAITTALNPMRPSAAEPALGRPAAQPAPATARSAAPTQPPQ